jgi:hypothetical protein
MSLSPNEASDALRDITETERRSVSALGYQMAYPHLILWGVIWVAGYSASAAHLGWDPLWLVLSSLGSAGSFFIGWTMSRGRAKTFDWRYAASFLVFFLFVFALFAIMKPHDEAQFAAFFPVLVSVYYALIGIWTRGLRMLFLAVALFAITMGGFFWLPQYFDWLMAAAGGGGLILGGFWLRSV